MALTDGDEVTVDRAALSRGDCPTAPTCLVVVGERSSKAMPMANAIGRLGHMFADAVRFRYLNALIMQPYDQA